MPTLEQIENGAAYKEHRKIGSKWAEEWTAKAIEHERVARELRALAST